jgi:hypothetical protein
MSKIPAFMPPKLDAWRAMTEAKTIEADGTVHSDSPSGGTIEAPELLRQLAEDVQRRK